MTQINLTPEQEKTLRRFKGADKRRVHEYQELYVDLADQLPDPLRVGDRVRYSTREGVLIALYCDYAWVSWNGHGIPNTLSACRLERA